MNRRKFIALTSSAAMAALLMPATAHAVKFYKPGLVKSLLAKGNTLVIDFTTEWCVTCAAQKRTIAALLTENPEYAEHIVRVTVDYDIYGRSELAKELKIPRRSTLVALGPKGEVGRIVAGTSYGQIKQLFDAALLSAKA